MSNDSDDEDWSDYDSEDSATDSDADSSPCPACCAEIYDDLDHCPRCGHWFTDADRTRRETGLFATRRVRWIALALLTIFLLSLLAELALLQ
jgi:hypothetical protein